MKRIRRNFRWDIIGEFDGSIDVAIATLEKLNEEAKREGYVDIKLSLEREICYCSSEGSRISIEGEREETKEEEKKRLHGEAVMKDKEKARELGQLAYLMEKYSEFVKGQ